MSMQKLYEMNGAPCKCGKEHTFSARVISGNGVISQLPAILKEYNYEDISETKIESPNTF